MSLLSQWNIEEDLLSQALLKSDLKHSSSGSGSSNIEDVDESLFMNKNQWRCVKYNSNAGGSSSYTPSYSDIRTLLSKGVQYRSHDTNSNWNWDNHYFGIRECYIYCTQATTLSTSFFTDDCGRLYLNGNSRATSGSCATVNVTLPFVKGLNHIEIMFYEWEGGDSAYLNTNLAGLSYVKWMYACYKSN